MKESKAVYVRKRDFNVELNREYQFYATNIIRDGEYSPQPARYYAQKSHEVGCQYDCKQNNLTCTYRYLNTPRRKQEIRYFGSPKQIYSYQGSRSFTDIGVGSVKALQRKKVKRIYLPETNDRGVGNSDWSSYILQRTKPQHQHKGSYYENKRTSSKCVGGILEYNIGCVVNEKLSPIIHTISGSTSYTDFNFNKNIEVGNSANARIFTNTSTQVANLITRDVEIEAEVVEQKISKDIELEIEQPRAKQIEKIAKPTIMTKAVLKELNTIAVVPRKPVKPQVIPPERVSSDSLGKPVKTKEKAVEEESSTESTRKRAKPKEKPTDSSSDSLLQHIHNLENPSLERNSRMSLEAEDLMENKLELEYRSIFAAKSKSKDSKNSARNSEIKSTSTLRRRFEALRRGLVKKDDSKKNSVIVKKEPSLVSANSRKDVSINSDPPSLEGRSFSNPKPYTPFPTRYSRDRSMHNPRTSQYRQPVTGNKKERSSADWSLKAGDDDSDVQGVKGMFKLWGKKFNLEEDNYNKVCTPKPSCNPARTEEIKKNEIAVPRIQEPSPPMQPVPEPELELEPDKKKEGRRFFFFKNNKKKDKPKDKEKEKPFKAKKGVTTGRCEVRDGLVIKILGDNVYNPEKICRAPETIPIDNEEIVRKSWLKKFLTPTIDSRNSVNVRWNNKTYAPSSSTVFELMDNIYKDTSIVFRSKSQVSVQSSYRSHKRQHVNFMKQKIEAWMIPKTFTDRPKLLPVKHLKQQLTCQSDEDTKDNMEVRISDQKWFIDKSKAFSHKIEVVLHSKNFKKLYKEESSEYLRIEIPKGFFVDSSTDEVTKPAANQSSDEEVFKIVEYETGSDLKKDKGTHVRDYKQNKIKVTVSVKESTKCVSKVLETPSPRPMNRDVIVQGSNVFIPKRCDIVGVGIITHRDLSQIRKPILKIQDDFSDEESEHNLLEPNTKKCEFAESYLQEYYRHWTPLGIDLYSWCASDSQLRCCSEHSRSSFQNQGDVTKSCPNIFEDFHTATIVSSCGASSCSGALQYKPQNMSDPSESGGKKKKKKEKEKKPDADRRVLPKDSIEVFKRRKIYAATNKSKWVTPWVPDSLQASGVPSVDSKCCDQNSTLHACPKPPRKSCCRQKEQSKSKRHVCKKHVSLPDCDTMNNELTKQLGNVIPESILAFKGVGGCDVCNKKKDSFVKHATLNPNASCEIPRAPCRDSCEQMKKSPCASAKQSCEKPPPCHRQCPIPRAPCESPKPSCPPKPCPPRPACPQPKPSCQPPRPACPQPKPSCPPPKPACPPPKPPCPPPKPACPPPKPPCPPPKPRCPQPRPACPPPKPACPPPKPACPQPRPCPSPPTPPCPTPPPQCPSPQPCCGKQSPSSPCCKKQSPQRSSHPSCQHIHIVATCPPKPPSPCPHTPPCLPKPQYPPCPPKPQNPPCPPNLSPPMLKLTMSPLSPPPTSSPPYTCPHTPPCLPLPNPRPCPPPAVPCTPPPRSPQSPQSPPKCPHSPPCSPLPEPCCCPPKPPSPPSSLPSPPSPRSPPCRPSTPSCPCGQQEEKPLAPIMKKTQCQPPSPPCGGFNTKECPMAPPSCPITPPQCCTDPKRCPYSPPPCSKKTSSCKKLFKKKPKSDTKCPASSPCKPLPCQPSFCKSLACQQSMTSISYTALRPDAPFYYSPIHPCAPDVVPQPKKQCNTSPCNPECNDEFPWPTKNQVSNQSSNTSLCENSQESFGKCKKDCPMMPRMSCETVPSVKECKPSCPNFGGSPRLPCLSKIPGMQCPPPPQPCPSPPAEPSSPPPPIPCRSKSKVSGLFLKMMPAPKKTTCSKDCSAWENGLHEDCISLNSTEKITIRLKKQTPSTAEIRECLNIKVQDEDEMTLFERKDYSFQHADCGVQRQPSLLGEMYKASEVRRVTTNNSTQAIGTDKETRKEIKEVPSEASVANLIEIQFKLKVTQGDKTTEINIANDGDKENRERKEPIQKSTPDVFVVKNEDERAAEHSDQKNDINIRIVIKNFKSKPGKKKFVNLKQDDYNDFSKNISAKFHTVSTGYSDVFHDDHVFSVHRATVDLTSSVENNKTDTTSMHSYKTEHSIKNVHSNKSVHGNKSDHSIKDWQSNKSVHSNKTALTTHGELINPSEHTKHVHSIKSVHGNKSDHSIKDDRSNKNDHSIKGWRSNKSVHSKTALTKHCELINPSEHTKHVHSIKSVHGNISDHSIKDDPSNKNDHSIKDWQSNKSVHSNKTALTTHGELINPSEHTKHVHSIKSVHGNKSDHSIKDDRSNKNDHSIKGWRSTKSVHSKTALTTHGELINPSEHTKHVHSIKSVHGNISDHSIKDDPSNKNDHSIKGWQSNKSVHSNKTALTNHGELNNPSEHTEHVHSNKTDHSIKGWQSNKSVHSNKTALTKRSDPINPSEYTEQVHSNKSGHDNKSDHSIKSWSNKSVHSHKTGQKSHSELIHHCEHTKQVHSNKSVHGKKSDHSIKGWHSNKSVHSNKTALTNHSELIHQTENTKKSVHGNKSDHSIKGWQSNKSVHGNKTALTKYSELIHQSVHSYKSEHTKQVSVHSYKSVYSNRSVQLKQSIHSNRSVEIINEPGKKRHFIGSSEASVCRCITTEDEKSGEDTDAKSFPSLKYSNTKETQDNAEETDTQVTDHKYEYNEDTDTEKPIKYDTEETDTDRQVDHPKYDTETDTEKRQNGKYDTFMSTTDTDEPDTLPEIRKSQSLDVIGKPKTKEEKKQMLKHIMEKVHDTKFKNKTRMRKLRDMLKVILTSDSSDHDDTKVKVAPNDLAKDVTYASLKPNYFRDTDSMHKYYEVDSTAVLSNATINGQIVYPSAENNSDCSNSVRSGDVMSSDNVDSSKREGCMCSTVAARLKLAARIGEVRGCCCSSKPMTKKSEETICDLKKESDYHVQIDNMTTEFVDVHTQNSRYLTSKLNSTNLSAHSSIKAGKSVSFNFEEGVNVGSGVLNVDSRQLNLKKTISPEKFHLKECEMRKRNRNAILNVSDEEKIVLRSGHSTRLPGHVRTRDDKQDMQHAADILQSYEAKKAVLEIYTEKTISDDGERLVAKLPKFVYDREQEIHANYEAMANNTYKSVCKKNFIMMAIKR